VVTIKDVARRADVSVATVSYVLNNRESVSQSTCERVLQAVRELGYRPNVIAQGLRAGESRMIGYSWSPVPPDQFNPVLDKFLQSMVETAEKAGYHILLFPCPPDRAAVEAYETLVATNRVDGFVLSSTDYNDQRIAYLMEIGFPFVAFGRANPEWDFSYVDVDNQRGVQEAVQYLLELGHRRIGLLAWPEDSLTGTFRLQGYLDAMAMARAPVDPAWIVRGANSPLEGLRCTEQMLALPPDRRPTAIMAMSDFMAIGAMNAIQNHGLTTGQDVALIGFDDAPLVQYLRPPLSSVRQPIVEVGQRIMDMLIRLIREEPLAERHVLLAPRLIVRESSGGPLTCG